MVTSRRPGATSSFDTFTLAPLCSLVDLITVPPRPITHPAKLLSTEIVMVTMDDANEVRSCIPSDDMLLLLLLFLVSWVDVPFTSERSAATSGRSKDGKSAPENKFSISSTSNSSQASSSIITIPSCTVVFCSYEYFLVVVDVLLVATLVVFV